MVHSASNLRFSCLARCHLSNVVRLNRRSENQARVTVAQNLAFGMKKGNFSVSGSISGDLVNCCVFDKNLVK